LQQVGGSFKGPDGMIRPHFVEIGQSGHGRAPLRQMRETVYPGERGSASVRERVEYRNGNTWSGKRPGSMGVFKEGRT
jgi:hypothetical protein